MIALAILAAATTGSIEADVLARSVARGEVLTQQDFVRGTAPAATTRFALRARDATGQEAKRTLPAGSTLRASDIGPPTLVRRGEALILMLRSGRLTITAPGRALGDGVAGGAVRVVNLTTNKALDARVIAPGAAELSAP